LDAIRDGQGEQDICHYRTGWAAQREETVSRAQGKRIKIDHWFMKGQHVSQGRIVMRP
jgi:hypothetical protein